MGVSPFPAPAAAVLYRTPSLLDCMDDDDDDGESSFHTARSPPESPSPVAADVDRCAAEFIERFRRNASLELRYLSPSPVTTPVRPPMSPDTYFKQSRLHQHLAAVAAGSPPPAAYGRRKSSLRPRPSGGSIKWPTAGRPTVRV
ncbi:hypothetical protein ABZP36_030953 [Zizania latifolia]